MSFFDTGSRAILAKVFHKLNCVVPVGLGFLFTFLNQGCNFVLADCQVIQVSEQTMS